MFSQGYAFPARFVPIGIALGLLLFGLHSAPSAVAVPAKVASPNEYATLVLNDPWDMHDKGNIPQPYQGVSNVSAAGNVWSATITGNPNSVGLMFLEPGFQGGLPIGKDGNNYMRDIRIDTSKYHFLSFRMNYTGSNSPIVAIYGTDGWDNFAGDPAQNYAAVGWITINPGWNNYLADLGTLGLLQNRNWTNLTNKKLTGLRFLLVNGQTGANIQFNWIRLTDASYSFSSTLNNPARLQFTAPSYTSGEDYATATRGSGGAWDMNSSADVFTSPPPWDASIDLTNFSFGSSIANFQNISNNSKLYLKGPENVPINSSKYRYLTYRFKIDGTWDLSATGGWVGRAIWFGPLGYGGDDAVTQDWYFREDWNTYNIDLATAPLETNRTNRSTWTSVQERILRITPNEGTLQQTMHLDYVRLTARDTADTSYTIRWNTINPDVNTVSITLYYDTDQDPTNGRTRIGSVSGNPGSYTWDTSGVSSGQVLYISADVNDGWNTTTWYSEAPLVIVHLGSIKTYLPLILR